MAALVNEFLEEVGRVTVEFGMSGLVLEPKELDIINVVVKKEGLRGLFDVGSKVLVDTDVFVSTTVTSLVAL